MVSLRQCKGEKMGYDSFADLSQNQVKIAFGKIKFKTARNRRFLYKANMT